MRLIRIRDFCKQLGIPRRTVNSWVQRDRSLAKWVTYKGKSARGIYTGEYWLRLDQLAKKPGFDEVTAFLLPGTRWIKAVDLARLARIPRITVAVWCRKRPGFAKRLGRIWYVDARNFDLTPEQLQKLFP